MLEVRNWVEEHILWDIRRGDCSALWDNWMGDGPIAFIGDFDESYDIKVKDFISMEWLPMVETYLDPEDLNSLIGKIWSLDDAKDEMIWDLQFSGSFSISSTYEKLRPRKDAKWECKFIWDSFVPSKISFFMLRFCQGRLPLDDQLRKFNIFGPSKCGCCSNAREESLLHVFLEGDLASNTWNFFENGFPDFFLSSFQQIRWTSWWETVASNDALRWILKVGPLVILWFLWKARNASRFEGQVWSVKKVCLLIFKELSMLFCVKFHLHECFDSWSQLLVFSFSYHTRRKVVCIRWLHPPDPWLKLTVDGASKGNPGPCGGGGIVRDSRGGMLFAFASFFGEHTSIYAEARALMEGLRIAVEKGYSNLMVESDSLILVNMIAGAFHQPWEIRLCYVRSRN